MAMPPPGAACCWSSQVRWMVVEGWLLSGSCVSAEKGCRKAHLAGGEVKGGGKTSR
jgi:hypothetical protein